MRKLDKNPEITKKAAKNGIFYWQISQHIGIADTTFSRWMRKELPPELKMQVLQAIDELVMEGMLMKA
ncbi:hypothetical protein [Desulfosporosinus sp.]|uniref:hypothetical protein n=1 Tax=Desulfosporosinus sp. TaxID=157907 RepID=UPI002602D790|nr:hypothetical protein [Desulfosporosinus sp.]